MTNLNHDTTSYSRNDFSIHVPYPFSSMFTRFHPRPPQFIIFPYLAVSFKITVVFLMCYLLSFYWLFYIGVTLTVAGGSFLCHKLNWQFTQVSNLNEASHQMMLVYVVAVFIYLILACISDFLADLYIGLFLVVDTAGFGILTNPIVGCSLTIVLGFFCWLLSAVW